jgi:hypothetical protein
MVLLKSRRNFIRISGITASGLLSGFAFKGSLTKLQNELPDLLVNNRGNPVVSVSGWNDLKNAIIKQWSDYLGIIEPNPVLPALKILNEESVDGLIRQYVEYENEPGTFVQAYLIKPQGIVKPLPGVVALHSTSDNKMLYISGVKKGDITPLGFNLAKMGFVVICPVCFLWHDRGERSYEQQVERFHLIHPSSKGMAKMLFDARRAVDLLVNLEDVDSSRIGAIGHSLGGKEAFYLGAFDDRVKVIVSNEGGIGISFSNWDASWYLGSEIHNFHHQHHELLALCAPKPFLLIGGDSADGTQSIPYVDAVKPVYRLYGKEENIRLYNHGQGHDITPEAEKLSYQWMTDHLKAELTDIEGYLSTPFK